MTILEQTPPYSSSTASGEWCGPFSRIFFILIQCDESRETTARSSWISGTATTLTKRLSEPRAISARVFELVPVGRSEVNAVSSRRRSSSSLFRSSLFRAFHSNLTLSWWTFLSSTDQKSRRDSTRDAGEGSGLDVSFSRGTENPGEGDAD